MSVLFFFKQKTAYEIGVRLVGSEMCIRDRYRRGQRYGRTVPDGKGSYPPGYLSANQDSDVKSDRIESSILKNKWYKTYRRMHMY